MQTNKHIGHYGESIAKKYLEEKGYKIIACNYRLLQYEIDIIAQQNEVLVIVEVKTRTSDYLGQPENAVSLQKQKSLKSFAELYLNMYKQFEKIRFDVIGIIVYSRTSPAITHFEDAFY